MGTLLGKAQIVGLTGGTVGVSSLSGYVSPNLQSLRFAHSGQKKTSTSQGGEVTSAYYHDDALEMTVDFIPEGSAVANTLAAAKLSAGTPVPGAAVVLSGLPVFAMGSFADALNGSWIYEGADGTLPNDDKQTMSMKLWRTKGITSLTPIT